MKGWWCVRYGDALAWVEAPTQADAVRRSLDLHPLGDWTDDARDLVVFPQDAYPDNTGRHDYTRAVLNARPPSGRRSSSRGTKSPIPSFGRGPCVARRSAISPLPEPLGLSRCVTWLRDERPCRGRLAAGGSIPWR